VLTPVQVANFPDFSVVSLQSDAIFLPHSAQFQPNAAAYMASALKMIKNADPNLGIHINAYADDIISVGDRQKLTDAQAQSVGSYLWSQGVDPSRLVMRGLGSKHMIGSTQGVLTNALNRRVQVLLVPHSAPEMIYPYAE
jgi:adhesin transport system outer membrane protein